MKTLNMKATKTISNPVEVTLSEADLECLVSILNEYRSMKERDDFDPNAISKMKAAGVILNRINH